MSKKEQGKIDAIGEMEEPSDGIALSSIAIDCLGEKEIRKRLEELK